MLDNWLFALISFKIKTSIVEFFEVFSSKLTAGQVEDDIFPA